MDKLELKDIRTELPFHIGRGLWFDWDRLLNNSYGEGVVDFDVPLLTKGINLQRPLCWAEKQKQELILSILKENPIPKVSLIMEYDGVGNGAFSPTSVMVIDGKQRLNAYIDFCNNKFPLPSGHYMNDLSDECKRVIYGFGTISDQATLYFGDRISDDDKIKWFSMINFSGTKQDEAHLAALLSANKS